MEEQKVRKYKTSRDIAMFYLQGHSGALTTNQEIKDLAKDIDLFIQEKLKEDVIPLMDESNFIAKHFKDNPICTVYRVHELNKNIEDKYGIKVNYTPTGLDYE